MKNGILAFLWSHLHAHLGGPFPALLYTSTVRPLIFSLLFRQYFYTDGERSCTKLLRKNKTESYELS